jgi:hypothetical protein
MEAVANSSKIVSKDTQALVNGISEVIAVINSKIKTTDWKQSSSLSVYNNPKLFSLVADLGTCDRKRLKRILNRCMTNTSLRNINSVIHFLSKTVYNDLIPTAYVRLSATETAIQLARKKYVESRKATEALQAKYKVVKGDYYKMKTALDLK